MHVYCSRAPSVVFLWTLEGSPRYRGGSCAICTGPASIFIVRRMHLNSGLGSCIGQKIHSAVQPLKVQH